jgi:hypothetical protein
VIVRVLVVFILALEDVVVVYHDDDNDFVD